MAGDFTPGLSGGQRKMLLFEIVKQRTASHYDLLIALDEPFAGVTDDFLPFITEQLTDMRKKHNILIVTNDHVAALTALADNTLTVSALDRTRVSVNGKDYDRELSLYALASGKDFYASNSTDMCDLWFFFDAEVLYNGTIGGVVAFTIFAMSLFVLRFVQYKLMFCGRSLNWFHPCA
jgi:energy-coupling factor transporter ATP-binding protein EcfA2